MQVFISPDCLPMRCSIKQTRKENYFVKSAKDFDPFCSFHGTKYLFPFPFPSLSLFLLLGGTNNFTFLLGCFYFSVINRVHLHGIYIGGGKDRETPFEKLREKSVL